MSTLLALLAQYAEVRPYWGCPEVASLVRPYLAPVAYGVGFGLVWLAYDVGNRWHRWNRRRGPADRRRSGTLRPPSVD